METVRVTPAPSPSLASSPSVATPKATTGAASGGRINPAAYGNRVSAVPGSTNAQSSLLDAIDFGDLPVDGLSLGDSVAGFPAGSIFDAGATPDSLDAFQSLLDSAPAESHIRDNKGDLGGLMPWGTMNNAGIRSAGQADFSAPDGGRFGGLGVDEVSVEQFSISHPVWGQLDVDSRRSPSSWDVVVRCAEHDTQQRLQSREAEFRKLLQREYGVSLALDVQVGRNR